MANDSSSNIIKNTSLITLATLTSRVAGLVRTWAMAFALGNTVLASAYNIAYNMPAMIYELAATGILATAFLPLYRRQKEKNGDSGAQTFASNILTLTTIVLGLLALACSIFSAQVIETQTFAGGDPAAKEMAIFFFRVFAVQILLYGLGAVITGILNAERIVFGTFARARAQRSGGHRDHVRLCAALFVEPLLCHVVVGGGNIAWRARAVRRSDSCAHKPGVRLRAYVNLRGQVPCW